MVEDDLDFVRAEVEGDLGFVTLHIGIGGAEGEVDRATNLHVGILEQMARQRDARAAHDHAVQAEFARGGAAFFEVGAGGVGAEQGDFEGGGEFEKGHCDKPEFGSWKKI